MSFHFLLLFPFWNYYPSMFGKLLLFFKIQPISISGPCCITPKWKNTCLVCQRSWGINIYEAGNLILPQKALQKLWGKPELCCSSLNLLYVLVNFELLGCPWWVFHAPQLSGSLTFVSISLNIAISYQLAWTLQKSQCHEKQPKCMWAMGD